MPLGNLPSARSSTGGGVEAIPVVSVDPTTGEVGSASVNVLAQVGVARKIAVNASSGASVNQALTTTTRRISIVAVGSAMRYAVGSATQTASATSHYIQQGERLDLSVPATPNIAALSDSATAGTLEITELV